MVKFTVNGKEAWSEQPGDTPLLWVVRDELGLTGTKFGCGVAQCGYCQSGQIMTAAGLLAKNKNPSRAQIVEHMKGNICRCGTYNSIVAAIQRAAKEV